jgi:hypothetical protein
LPNGAAPFGSLKILCFAGAAEVRQDLLSPWLREEPWAAAAGSAQAFNENR